MKFWLAGLACCLLLGTHSSIATENVIHGNAVYERTVLDIVDTLQQGNLAIALTKVDLHLQKYPKSRLGYLLKADIVRAMSSPLLDVADGLKTSNHVDMKGFKHELKNRWLHGRQIHPRVEALLPSSLLDMGRHKHVIVSDTHEGRLYLYRNNQGKPELVKDYYMTVGSAGYGKQVEGDNKTPIGVYSIYKYIDDEQLPDLYGKGAFPVDYPNIVDRYRKRTGYGIWLHGTPSNTYARSPWASEGCFVLSNDDFSDISRYISVTEQTPVILSDGIQWVNWEELEEKRRSYLAILQAWKTDWESLDADAYIEHYKRDQLNFGKVNFSEWAARKKQVNQSKTFIQIDMDIESLLLYPGEKDMFVVKYKQRYMSNNFHSEAKKEQYWQRNEQGKWQIVYEG